MTTGAAAKSRVTLQGIIGLLGLFAGLCSIFALVVSIAEGWREHEQAKWPQVSSTIQRCTVEEHRWARRSAPRASSYIECKVLYELGSEEVLTWVRSRSIASAQNFYWEYPTGRVERMQAWVDAHKTGPIVVHYDPGNHKHAALVSTDMPYGGPRTPGNLRLLAMSVIACVVLLTIARVLRPRPMAAPAGAS